ncbi:hypothetical protein [Aureibacter tunicatorum]|uniref:Uncharacterized protein n=1 Tax=Aureibacter tunicatorum TaxID=866807 RepID=A0AAE3XQ69_9BACT|nr:hypothetical protein [Aureibacter tunicatorum]MDR6240068.1 hypothetical protein [Aureibacter tunicatorum]BDD04540.1 hypothetical protein AUTU_20230 [Aureibacter tunicatorum]
MVEDEIKEKFLYISETRFLLMNIVTFGVFERYWIYKNWKCLKQNDGLDIMPFWRGIFGIFFIHTLLDEIAFRRELYEVQKSKFNPRTLATLWVVVQIGLNILGKIENDLLTIFLLFITVISSYILVPVQRYINNVYEEKYPDLEYSSWSKGQVICLIVGVIISLVVLSGLFSGFIF